MRPSPIWNLLVWISLVSTALTLAGCAQATVTSDPTYRDPRNTQRASGGTDDIYEATGKAINSLVVNDRLRRHLEQTKGNRVQLNRIVNQTGIPGYDERLIYNRFLAGLTNNAGERLIFLSRDSVAAEREAQLSGQVKTAGVDAQPAGADLILDIELRQLSGVNNKLIQYTFKLTKLNGEVVWTDSFDILKSA